MWFYFLFFNSELKENFGKKKKTLRGMTFPWIKTGSLSQVRRSSQVSYPVEGLLSYLMNRFPQNIELTSCQFNLWALVLMVHRLFWMSSTFDRHHSLASPVKYIVAMVTLCSSESVRTTRQSCSMSKRIQGSGHLHPRLSPEREPLSRAPRVLDRYRKITLASLLHSRLVAEL